MKDTLTFEGGGSYTATWQKGFYVNADGRAGHRYFSYTTPAGSSPDTLELPLGTKGTSTRTAAGEAGRLGPCAGRVFLAFDLKVPLEYNGLSVLERL